MSSVAYTLIHAGFQTITGVLSGTVIDTVFPEPKPIKSGTDVLETSAEVLLQFSADALLTAAMVKVLITLDLDMQDPTSGFAFVNALILSQPNLNTKLSTLSSRLRAILLADKAWAIQEIDGVSDLVAINGSARPNSMKNKTLAKLMA